MCSSILRSSLRAANIPTRRLILHRSCGVQTPKVHLHTTPSRNVIKPYLLADIGEGITECRVVQWFVKPGDRVNQFDAICEVQSDKASVEITSRYDGVITSMHREVDEMAIVGQPLLDIDVEDEPSDLEQLPSQPPATQNISDGMDSQTAEAVSTSAAASIPQISSDTSAQPKKKNSGLVVPAVRLMLREHKVDIEDVEGTGKEGRVLKEDVLRHLQLDALSSLTPLSGPTTIPEAQSVDKIKPLTSIEMQMFKVMTRALSIPHFGYAHSVDFTALNSLRRKSNERVTISTGVIGDVFSKLTPLPFILKALSQAFLQYPKLNAHLDTEADPEKPRIVIKQSHDFGIAVDTPNGLLVPVIKGVQSHSILSLAAEVKRLSAKAKEGRLTPFDMSGASFTVSNIGSIGGSVVNPIIVPPTVAIVGVGRVEEVPVFGKNERGELSITKREKIVLSWSADHRVLDGAAVARCAELVGEILENIKELGLTLC